MSLIEVDGGPIKFIEDQARGAFGLEEPEDQITGSFLLGLAIIATSSIGLVFTLVLLPIPVTLFVLGVIRLWGPVDDRWPLN